MMFQLTLQCIMCFLLRVTGLRLNATPANIEPGTTTSLLVNCSLNIASTPPLVILNSLVILRSNDLNTSTLEILASVNSINGRVVVYDGDGVGSGLINNKGGSYLSVQWAFPFSNMAGQYICEVNGMALSGLPQTSTTSVKVSSTQLNFNSMSQQLRLSKVENSQRIEEINRLTETVKVEQKRLTDKIQLLQERMDNKLNSLEDNVIKSSEFINKIKQENSELLKILFIESPPYNGRKYYLSRQSVLVTTTSAQAECTKYGGYLAEIDNEDELQFLRRFMNSVKSHNLVRISGSDEGHEDYWVSSRNDTAPTYIKMSGTQPDGGDKQNCLCIYQGGDWYMGDTACVHYSIEYVIGYLCEIPEQ